MIFVPTSDNSFIVSEKYFWLCKHCPGQWHWTYDPVFGIKFNNEDDAILFRLKYA